MIQHNGLDLHDINSIDLRWTNYTLPQKQRPPVVWTAFDLLDPTSRRKHSTTAMGGDQLQHQSLRGRDHLGRIPIHYLCRLFLVGLRNTLPQFLHREASKIFDFSEIRESQPWTERKHDEPTFLRILWHDGMERLAKTVDWRWHLRLKPWVCFTRTSAGVWQELPENHR